MDMQEASGSTNAKSICISSEELCVNIGISSLHGHQLKEMASSVYDHATKVRKPYTITKQRERWTDEEHEKFLEALKLYGRAWRQIEEHIGTKTAVQIRSHAQKFFSKVAHESAIEIPPPRPKRKPTHPYPRKLGHSRSLRTPEQPEWSYAPIPSPSEQENGSPTSVLSAFRSDTPGPSVSNLPSGCTSQFSSMAGSNQPGMFMSHGDNRGQLHVPSSEEEDRSPSPGIASPMELSLGGEAHAPLEEDTSVEAQGQGTSLKLFGRTVLVTDPQKLSSGSVQCPKLPCTSEIQSRDRSADADMHTQAQPIPSEDFQGAPGDATWSQWPPMLFCLPPCGDSVNSAVPVPWWWTLCGTSQFQFSNAGAEQDACQLEGSSNGSETGSASHMVDSRSAGPPMSELPPSSSLRHCASSAFSSFNPGVPKPARGFMPYKRCATKQAIVDLPVDDLDGDSQPIELCL